MEKKARKNMESATRVESLKSFTISVFSLFLINHWFSSKYLAFFIILRLDPCDFGKRTDNFQFSQWRQSYFIKKNYMIIVVLSRFASFEQVPLIRSLRKLIPIIFLPIENTSRGRKVQKPQLFFR